ncbi:hypothetical protein [Flavisolibacter ginsengisoli]|uniref:hypothetical protein n=1 Tax=Flavisolibacter ginsengisoli TaxID=462367 RepID=UPI0009325DA5|nr:hypothetical protein [Flavisolibacter ginsengisoli]
MDKVNLFFIYLDITAPLVVFLVVLFAVLYRGLHLRPFDRILISFLLAQILLNSLANFLQYHKTNNHWVYHLNCITTQVIFSVYFFFLFTDVARKKILLYGSLIFILFYVLNIVFIQPYYTFNSYSYAMGAFLFVAFALMSFYGWMEGLPATNILQLKEFWGAAGILFYFGSSFFIFISYEYLSEVSAKNVGILWKLHNVFLTLGCFIFLKAIFSKQWILKSSS